MRLQEKKLHEQLLTERILLLTTVQGLVTDFDENNLDLGIKQNVNTIVQKKEKKKLKQNKAQ